MQIAGFPAFEVDELSKRSRTNSRSTRRKKKRRRSRTRSRTRG